MVELSFTLVAQQSDSNYHIFILAENRVRASKKNRFQQAPHLRLLSGLSGLIWQICFIYNLLLTEILIRDRKKNTQNKYIQSINILADVHKTMKTTTSDGRKKVFLSYFLLKNPRIYIEEREMSNTWLQLLSFCFVANSKNNKQIAYIVAARKMTHAFPYKIRIFSFSSSTEYDPLFPKCASWIVVRVKIYTLLHVLRYRQESEDAWWKLLKSCGYLTSHGKKYIFNC